MTDHVQQLIWGAAWTASIVASAFCSGIETGCYSLNRVRLDLRGRRTPPDTAAVIIRDELKRPERLLATLLIANNMVHFASAEAMHRFLHPFGWGELFQAGINALVIAPMLFIFGEAVPKELFRIEADRLTYKFAHLLRLTRSMLTFSGILGAVRGISRLAERLTGLTPEAVGGAREHIALLLKEGASHGLMSESQATLIDRALAFRGVTAGDEMTPWTNVRAVPAEADRTRASRIIGDAAIARLPVIDRTGRVIGVVRQVDFHLRPGATARELMTPAVRLKRGTPVPEALAALHVARARLGIVEDETGRPVGIVTPKDLAEPLIGEM
ncbi:MAG: DUF21 domain-containing protein [Planctomycetes bacterium]|nr:DUF21 domain-containing protein [Planctomycetota bacterium]